MSTKKAFEESKTAMEGFETLLKRGLGREGSRPLQEFVGGKYEPAIEYARVEREQFVGEVGKRDGNYVYHFWPRTEELLSIFGDVLGDAMIQVFKYEDRLSAKHDEVWRCFEGEESAQKNMPLCRYWGPGSDFSGAAGQIACPQCRSKDVRVTQSSWAVKVTGYANNPMADALAAQVFDVLAEKLKERTASSAS